MDSTDKKILDMIRVNARMPYQEIADCIGLSRVAVQKRISKLERSGVIRGYETVICRDDERTAFLDVDVKEGSYEKMLDYLVNYPKYITSVYKTAKENIIHVVAVAGSAIELQSMIAKVQKECEDDIASISGYTVKEIIKDGFGGTDNVRKKSSDHERDGSVCKGKKCDRNNQGKEKADPL